MGFEYKNDKVFAFFKYNCLPLNWINLGQMKSDNINRMIQLTEETFSQENKEKS